MPWTPSPVTVKGVTAGFEQAMKTAPSVWRNHTKSLPATTEVMPYAFLGFIPQPRQMIDGRKFVNINSFSFNVTNYEYELSFSILRKWFEDDQLGAIQSRINEVAAVVADYDDYLFAQMLINGGTSGYTGWDGTTFFSDTRVIGQSANIDNNTTSVAAAGDAIPTSLELLADISIIKPLMWAYQDDTGARPFNSIAAQKIRLIVPPTLDRPCSEAFSSNFITQSDNPWGKGLCEYDITPYLPNGTTTQIMYASAIGDTERMPFIRADRMPLEIVIDQTPEHVARANAVEVLCRWRAAFAYGEPRRSLRHTYTT